METRYQKRIRMKKERKMQLFIKSLTGKTIIINANDTNSVKNLKKIIGEREGIASDNIVLRGGIRTLYDDKSIRENGIDNNATLHLTLRLRGGSLRQDPQEVGRRQPAAKSIRRGGGGWGKWIKGERRFKKG